MTLYEPSEMTTEELKKKHPSFSGSELFQDICKWFEAKHPIRRIPRGDDKAGLLLTGAPVLLNHAVGFEEAYREFREIPEPPKEPKPEPPDTFKDNEIKA